MIMKMVVVLWVLIGGDALFSMVVRLLGLFYLFIYSFISLPGFFLHFFLGYDINLNKWKVLFFMFGDMFVFL